MSVCPRKFFFMMEILIRVSKDENMGRIGLVIVSVSVSFRLVNFLVT
jgi:hypothetical protein